MKSIEEKEAADLAFQQAIDEARRSAERVKMTEQQKREYKLYRAACRFAGVEPTRADFLAGDIPSCVTQEMEWQRGPYFAMGLEEFIATYYGVAAKALAVGA